MNDQQRPLLGFLWPQPEVPRDGDAVQSRLIRVPARGPARLALLVLASLGLVVVTASALLAAIGTTWWLVLPAAAVIATFWVLLLRAWTVGTYVNDLGVVDQRLLGVGAARWSAVSRVDDVDGRVVVTTRDGRVFETHVRLRSLDIWGRAERYDIAKTALRNWAEQR